ncbi:hypothetical protein DFJ73DRAFT_862644 [Zopfochytrium polystomum]|nr:hypothetical protein DFJ73DRAFT_862644 [Zopfochytrium polystomum]
MFIDCADGPLLSTSRRCRRGPCRHPHRPRRRPGRKRRILVLLLLFLLNLLLLLRRLVRLLLRDREEPVLFALKVRLGVRMAGPQHLARGAVERRLLVADVDEALQARSVRRLGGQVEARKEAPDDGCRSKPLHPCRHASLSGQIERVVPQKAPEGKVARDDPRWRPLKGGDASRLLFGRDVAVCDHPTAQAVDDGLFDKHQVYHGCDDRRMFCVEWSWGNDLRFFCLL